MSTGQTTAAITFLIMMYFQDNLRMYAAASALLCLTRATPSSALKE
jgi:hypothetical protein